MATILSAHKNPASGYLFVVVAAILWAVSGTAAKHLFQNGVSPFHLVQMRLTIASALLFAWMLATKPAHLWIARRDIFYFFIFGAFGMASVQFTYLFAISKINVAAAILLQYLAPAFIALYAVIFSKERLSPATMAALAGAFLGCYLMVGAYSLDLLSMNLAGIISGLLSAVGFAWYSIQGQYGMERYSAWTVLFYALLFAALMWNVLISPLDGFLQGYPLIQWGWIAYIGFMGTLLPFGLYLEGVRRIRAPHASITATLEPITAGFISYLFLGERLEGLQVAGAILVIGAIILIQLPVSPKKHPAPADRAAN